MIRSPHSSFVNPGAATATVPTPSSTFAPSVAQPDPPTFTAWLRPYRALGRIVRRTRRQNLFWQISSPFSPFLPSDPIFPVRIISVFPIPRTRLFPTVLSLLLPPTPLCVRSPILEEMSNGKPLQKQEGKNTSSRCGRGSGWLNEWKYFQSAVKDGLTLETWISLSSCESCGYIDAYFSTSCRPEMYKQSLQCFFTNFPDQWNCKRQNRLLPRKIYADIVEIIVDSIWTIIIENLYNIYKAP